ncbi:MAG: 30S ribosomal protein S1 [Flavobacteriales bacterium]|nr:30S ribosomal protein S1 [Flavobacteriales bacterium]
MAESKKEATEEKKVAVEGEVAEKPKAKKTTKKAADKSEKPAAKKATKKSEDEAAAVEAPATEEAAPAVEAKEEVAEVKAEKKAEPRKPMERPADFDWSAIGKKDVVYAEKERKALEEMYDSTITSFNSHDVVDGKIIDKTKKDFIVTIGGKSEGAVPVSETRYNPEFEVGDTIEVYIEKVEDKEGQLVLSHKKARALRSWERVNEALEKDEVIRGLIKCRTKGGLIADVFGIEAFLPGSQIDVKPIRDYDIYVGKTMEFKVVKINNEYKNVVVSHKALIQEELESQKKEIIGKLEKGQILEGTVKNITSYGVFVDLGGVDGLIHITDLSWGRINHPEEIVELDQKINVVILDFDDDKKRIALGLKQLSQHPWDAMTQEVNVGDKVKGKVVVVADYGAFVEVAPGVEGLLHVSEMSWSQHLRSASDFLKVGDEVECVVLTLDKEDRKMSLGMKQLMPDPWADIMTKYPVGSQHTAKVRSFTNFGIFVELEEGVDGLVHISDLSWNKKIKHPSEFTSIDADLEVKVLEIDAENRRLSLGHKQLEENPWDVFETVFTIDSVHQGTVTGSNDKGATVALPYGVEGFCPKRHMKKEDGSDLKNDETADFKVIEFNKDSRRILVSHAKVHSDEAYAAQADEKEKTKSSTSRGVKKVQQSQEKTTLGDLDALADLKSQMEESEKKKK